MAINYKEIIESLEPEDIEKILDKLEIPWIDKDDFLLCKTACHNIDLDEECGNIDIEGGVGKFDLKLSKVGGNLTYKGGVGEANITIPENAPVDIKSGTGLGDFKQTAKTSGEGKYIFDVKTGIGSITIDN